MPSFRYQALNADQTLVTGELTADTVEQAVAQLHATGLAVQSIGVVAATAAAPAAFTPPADRNVEQAALRTHVARVLELGKSITPALRAYAEEMSRGRRRRQLNTVIGVLERNDATEATAALAALPDYWIPLLSAATSAQDPGRVLSEFLGESERADEIRRQWWLALAYPVFVVTLAALVFVALSFVVIPVFAAVFGEFGLELPAFTRIVVTLASWVTRGQAFIIALFCVVFGALLWTARGFLPESVRATFGNRFSFLFGRRTAIARFARFTADLLEGGLGTSDAIRIAGFATNKSYISAAAWRLATELAAGKNGARQLDTRPLTATVLHALHAEMTTPARIQLLREISNCHAIRARLCLSWMRGIVEPLSICVVGAIVGSIVIALFLPLVKLIEGLSK